MIIYAALLTQDELPAEFFVLDSVGNGQRFVPTELLCGSHAKRFLRELPGAFETFAAQPDSHGFVQSFFERDSTLRDRVSDQSFHVGIQSDRGSHIAIVASEFPLS